MAPHRNQVHEVFASLLRVAREACPGLKARVRIGKPEDFPEERNYAHCLVEPDPDGTYVIEVSDKMLHRACPRDRIEGVLAHELGHAALLGAGHTEHSEQDADEMAKALTGLHVYYDHACIQTSERLRGRYTKRPPHLPR